MGDQTPAARAKGGQSLGLSFLWGEAARQMQDTPAFVRPPTVEVNRRRANLAAVMARQRQRQAMVMIRTITLGAILSALATAAAVYMGPMPRTQLAATEEWPICTTMGSLADNADWAQLDPDFAAGKKAMAAGDWNGAIVALNSAALRDPRNADIQNYIGYSYRRLRQLEPAFAHYWQALSFNPRHRAAHEHMGEAYLSIGDVAAAERHLAALEGICLIPCDEYGDLQRAITMYRNSVHRTTDAASAGRQNGS